MDTQPYKIGQLLARLIKGGWEDDDALRLVMSNVRDTLLRGINKATRSGEPARKAITPLVEQVGEMPITLNAEEQGEFWLGYYHGRRGPGRPEGSTKPDDDPTKRNPHEITVTDTAWDKAKATGNASQFIEKAILAYEN